MCYKIYSIIGEVKLMSALGKHPNIVNLKYMLQSAQCMYVAMELVPGGDLLQIVESGNWPRLT